MDRSYEYDIGFENAAYGVPIDQDNVGKYSDDNPEEVVFNYNARKKCNPSCEHATPLLSHELLCLDVERYPIVFTRDLVLGNTQTTYAIPSNSVTVKDVSEYVYSNLTYPPNECPLSQSLQRQAFRGDAPVWLFVAPTHPAELVDSPFQIRNQANR